MMQKYRCGFIPQHTPVGLGPHEGRELMLLLRKKKRVAVFLEIDPRNDFAPYVRSGRLIRRTVSPAAHPNIVTTFYALPQARIALLELMGLIQGDEFNIETERRIGFLLGYTSRDVDCFIRHRKNIHLHYDD